MSLYSKISNVLEELLKNREHTIESPPSDTEPLFLLLTVKPNLIGFSVLDGCPEVNYSLAFQNLKKLYSLHSSEWADFDLSLVLCSTDAEKTTDEFCNKIEMDPYFCRKFVIDLNKDIQAELGRLPYIPLSPEKIVGLQRPISAQTFLRKHGVVAELARYLVVPHARGIERIIEECIEGVLGEPKWLATEIDQFFPSQDEFHSKIRLKEVEVSNFRVYREAYKFDLDADLVILFGPNGLGKTSFFDAIDFVCTGGVARLDERFGRNTNRLLNALKHLDSSIEASFVKATTLIERKVIQLERYMKDRTNATFNGEFQNRTKTLMELAGLSAELPDLRVENLISLFRATHLFGQEYQFLTSEIRTDSRLPENTVSRMLAFQDYVEAINKTRKVSEKLKSQIKEKESEISNLKNSLESKIAETKKLSLSVKISKESKTILAIGKELAERIMRDTSIQIQIPNEFNQEIIREWRALIAAHIGSINQNLELLQKLEVSFPQIADHKNKLEKCSLQLDQKKKALSAINLDYQNKEKKLQELDEKIKQMLLEERTFSLKKENLNWLLQTKVEYTNLKEQLSEEYRNCKDIQAKLLELVSRIESLKSKYKQAQNAIDIISSEIRYSDSKLHMVNDLLKNLDAWQRAIVNKKDIEMSLINNQQQIDILKNDLRIKKDELNNAIINKDKLKNDLDSLQKSQSELQTLLDNIEKHLLDNICPVCGTTHKSREELLQKLNFQRGIQPKHIQQTLKLFEDAHLITEKLQKYIANSESKLKSLEKKNHEAKEELVQLESIIKKFDNKAISLSIQLIPEKFVDSIELKKTEVYEQANKKQKELADKNAEIKKLTTQLNKLIKQQETLQINLRTSEQKQAQLRTMTEKINSDASDREVSIEMKKEMIERDITLMINLIKDLFNNIEIQRTEKEKFQKEINQLFKNKNNLAHEIQQLNTEISALKKYVEEIEYLVKSLNLESDLNMERILTLKNELKQKISSLDLLQNEIANFEIALDTMQITATLSQVLQEIENIKKQYHELENYDNKLRSWLSYFDNIHKELYSMQNQALREYTDKYGSLTSIIQRRLRPVYGFGNIRLNPEKGGITVRIERQKEKNIFPSDYFSESQIQIIMLSLFLSAFLTQTWSSFAPILLDDPVEHFDDLNAYSLLELIRELILQSDGEHQFIISTCEDRLFRLMREKFSKLNRRVIYYVFESIGENGPKIKMLIDG